MDAVSGAVTLTTSLDSDVSNRCMKKIKTLCIFDMSMSLQARARCGGCGSRPTSKQKWADCTHHTSERCG